MARLKPVPSSDHSKQRCFIYKELKDCSHAFIRNDAVLPALTPPYSGPYLIQERFDKFYKMLVDGKSTTVSIDRLKPAFLSEGGKFLKITTWMLSQPGKKNHRKQEFEEFNLPLI